MVGMLVHLDASTHEWIAGLPKQDLVVVLDDADGRMLHARTCPGRRPEIIHSASARHGRRLPTRRRG